MFLAHAVHIQLATPQAAQLSLHFYGKVENQYCCTSTRDLIKDKSLMESDKKEKKKSPAPSVIQTREL